MVKKGLSERDNYEAEDFNLIQRNVHISSACPVTSQWNEPKVFESTFFIFFRVPFFFSISLKLKKIKVRSS